MTEKESAHPQPVNVSELSLAEPAGVARPQEGAGDAGTADETGAAAQVGGIHITTISIVQVFRFQSAIGRLDKLRRYAVS